MESKPRSSYWGTISFDYDNDGLLDIYVVNFNYGTPYLPTVRSGYPHFLYRNEGNGRFTEI